MDGGLEAGFETCMTGNLDRRRGEPDNDDQAYSRPNRPGGKPFLPCEQEPDGGRSLNEHRRPDYKRR